MFQTKEQLDSRCEEFLGSLNETADFEVEDALDKLDQDGLLISHVNDRDDDDPAYSVVGIGTPNLTLL